MAREKDQPGALGEFIRQRRRLANLSMRELARLAQVSNPYLSQIERGVYKPSAKVLKSIAEALQVSAETLYAKVGLLEGDPDADLAPGVEEAVRADPRLSPDQKRSLLQIYRSFVDGA